MTALTVRELKEKLANVPDDFLLAVDHIEFTSNGEAEITEDVEVIDIRRPLSVACISFVTKQNIVEESEAIQRYDEGYKQGYADAKNKYA